MDIRKKTIAEFLASFMLGFFGLGLVVPFAVSHYIKDIFQYSILFGTIIGFIVILFNTISGAQFNPAVTLAMVFSKRQDKRTLFPFCVAQILGWGLGSALIYVVFWNQCKAFFLSGAGNPTNLFFCTTADLWSGVFLEFFGTGLMLVLILAMIDPRIANQPTKALFPFAITLYIMFVVSWTGCYTGTAINTARDLGPRIFALIYGLINGYDVSACFSDGIWLLYLIVPNVGAICGTLFYDKVVADLLPNRNEALDQ